MTRKLCVVVAFGLGAALAPLVYQLGTACLHPVAVVAQDNLFDPPTIPQNPTERRGFVPDPAGDLPIEKPSGENGPTANSADTFIELSKQKGALLTPEEMAREVDSLRKELPELRATVLLREAVGKLKQLIREYPQSQAAQRAARMLEAETASPPGIDLSPSLPPADLFSAPGRLEPQLAPVNSLPTY